jgi:hypothetical protein
MLIRLLPNQVANFWDIIKYAIEESLPPIAGSSKGRMNNILSSLLAEKIQCWAAYKRKKDSVKLEAIVLTKVQVDDITQTKHLLIYCLYSYSGIHRRALDDGFEALTKYAKSIDCQSITAYTSNEALVAICRTVGAEINYFIRLDVNKSVQKLNELG